MSGQLLIEADIFMINCALIENAISKNSSQSITTRL